MGSSFQKQFGHVGVVSSYRKNRAVLVVAQIIIFFQWESSLSAREFPKTQSDRLRTTGSFLMLIFASLCGASATKAYGPLNHLCVAAEAWPQTWSLIQKVDPRMNEASARADFFAGAMADDLGYYPVPGADQLKFLTDLMHYTRTGELVSTQLRDAAEVSDGTAFAFALGELSHYAADRMGHYYGTNMMAVEVANEQELYGSRMSYERDEATHFVVESGFDVMTIESNCSPDRVQDIINNLPRGKGWEGLNHVLGFLQREYGKVYRTKELVLKEEFFIEALLLADELLTETAHKASLLYGVSIKIPGPEKISSDSINWIADRVTAGIKFAGLNFQNQRGTLDHSFRRATDMYLNLLKRTDEGINNGRTGMDRLSFEDINLDTNMKSASGVYKIADKTYEHLSVLGSGKSSCPPRSRQTQVGDYFVTGERNRLLLLKPAKNVTAAVNVGDSVAEVDRFLRQQVEETQSEAFPKMSLATVQFETCSAGASCRQDPASSGIPLEPNVTAGTGIVYFTAQATLVDLWFGALAATSLMNGNEPNLVFRQVTYLRLRVREDYRLNDVLNDQGYYAWPDYCTNATTAEFRSP